MRLLHAGATDVSELSALKEPQPDGERDSQGNRWQLLPVHGVPGYFQVCGSGGPGDGKSARLSLGAHRAPLQEPNEWRSRSGANSKCGARSTTSMVFSPTPTASVRFSLISRAWPLSTSGTSR